MPGRPSSQQGFSLLWLLLVLTVLSLCAATTVRWYFSRAEVTLENAAILLARDLRAAQHRSIFLNERTRFQFLPTGEGYTVAREDGELAVNPTTELPFLRLYGEDGVFIGVQVIAADAGGDRTLEIDARGLALEDLSVTLGFDGEERTVQLDARTGRIRILGSTSDWQDQGL